MPTFEDGQAPAIPGCQLLGVIGKGATSVVYRGLREGCDVAIKISNLGTDQAAALFRQEATALARVSDPGVVKLLDSGEAAGARFVVMELIEGDSLAARIAGGALSEADLLAAARDLASALAAVHACDLVHRDVKPSNILIRGSQHVLIDFGFAGHVDQDSTLDRAVVGTFLYGAPEQTGFLARSVDGRSDLYSLGCVLFECATGRPLYQANDVSEILTLHASAAIPDLAVLRQEIRPAFAAIIRKLLSKDPDDRYQSARALLWDLEHLHELETDRRNRGTALLGRRDTDFQLVAQVPLVGRSHELATLSHAWSRARAGEGSWVQIEGEPGCGKTRLVRELLRVARSEGAIIMSGKGQKAERTPFGALRDALDQLLERTRADSPERLEALLGQMRASTAVPGIVRRLSRSLLSVFRDAEEVRPLEPEAEQERFYEKVAEFLGNLAQQAGGLILVVDDIQWLDDGTARVLRKLANRLEGTPLLLATTARNDAESAPATAAFRKAMAAAGTTRIELSPLDVPSVDKLIAAYLGDRRLDPAVTQRLAARSSGNPFALEQYIRALLEQGILWPTPRGWQTDIQRLNDAILSNDVIQLLVARVDSLPSQLQTVLGAAAVLGFGFGGTALVSTLATDDPQQVRRALDEAIRSNLVEQTEGDRYAFVHDRIPEALLARLTPEAFRRLNRSAARAIERLSGFRVPEHQLFALARHYAAADFEEDRRRIFETSMDAGVHALESYANNEAYDLLDRAYRFAALLHDVPPAVGARLQEQLGVACARTGRLDDAKSHFEKTMAQVQTRADRARLHYLISLAYSSEGNNEKAWEENKVALSLMGVRIPTANAWRAIHVLFYWLLTATRIRTGWKYGASEGDARERHLQICKMLNAAYFTVYYMGDFWRVAMCSFLRIHHAHYLGASAEYASALASHTLLLIVLFGDRAQRVLRNEGARAINMAKQIGDSEAYAFSRACVGMAADYSGKTTEGQALAWEALPDMVKYCIARDAGLFIGAAGISVTHRGRTREALEKMEAWLPTMKRMGTLHYISNVLGSIYVQMSILGRQRDAVRFKAEQARIASQMPSVRFVQSFLYCHTIHALYEQDIINSELETAIDKFLTLNFDHPLNRVGYLVCAYVRLEQYLRTKGVQEKRRTKKALLTALRTATLGPPLRCILNPVHRCHVRVIQAAVAREEGRFRKSLQLLARAEDDALASDSQWGQWAVLRERARVYACQGKELLAHEEAERALELAVSEGWPVRAERIRREFDIDAERLSTAEDGLAVSLGPLSYGSFPRGSRSFGASARSVATTMGVPTLVGGTLAGIPLTRAEVSGQRNFEALLDVTRAAASSLDARTQYVSALDALLRAIGAERSYLFLDQEGLTFCAGRDSGGADVQPTGYSSTVVRKSFEENQPVVVTGTEEGRALGSESAVAHDLRSIMAVPVAVGERKLGVLYVDSRLVKGLFTQDQLSLLEAIARQIGVILESSRAARAMIEVAAMKRDLALMQATQELCLPRKATTRLGVFDVAGCYRPAAHASGDWWWYEQTENGGVRVLVGDVTGHGPGPAMVSVSVAACYRLLRRVAPVGSLVDALGTLDDMLEDLGQGEHAMTVAAICIQSGELECVTAGAPPVLIARSNGKVDVLCAPSSPLGGGSRNFVRRQVPFGPGDRVLLLSDGLFDLPHPTREGRRVGLRDLQRLVEKAPQHGADNLVRAISEGLRLESMASLEDDVTYVVVGDGTSVN